MRKAVITGGLGFIGYHLSRRLLSEGFRVTAIDNLERGRIDQDLMSLQADSRYSLVTADLADGDMPACVGDDVTHVFHLAAIVGVQNVISQPYRVLRANALGLMQMLAWSRTLPNLSRFVFTSTSEVYDGTLLAFGLGVPTPETTPLAVIALERPRTLYMLSKIHGEGLCHHAGVPFTIVRPHNVYGPRMGMAHVVPELLHRAWQTPAGGDLIISSPDHTRTFCYVSDAVELITRLALAPEAAGRTFNVGADLEDISIMELANLIAATVGKPLRIVPGQNHDGSTKRRRPDLKQTIAATAYRPAVTLAEGIEATCRWYHTMLTAGGPIADVPDQEPAP